VDRSDSFWNFLLFGPLRDLDTIHLAAGVKENIVGKVETFLRKGDDYKLRQISHHLGFCLVSAAALKLVGD
jgi:chaperone BCS1